MNDMNKNFGQGDNRPNESVDRNYKSGDKQQHNHSYGEQPCGCGKQSQEGGMDRVKDKLNETGTKIKHNVQETATKVGNRVEETAQKVGHKAEEWGQKVADNIKEKTR